MHVLLWVLQYPNSAVPSSSSLSMEQKSTGSITETCCWRRNCYQQSAALLETCYFVFQQDNAPAHRACDRVEPLHRETLQFISPDMWPSNSPDLNPVDYRVWGILQEWVYRVLIRNTDELRKRLVAAWAEFQYSVVDYAWSVAKKTGSMYPCTRWSLWALAAMCSG